jgi:hypothetical protein
VGALVLGAVGFSANEEMLLKAVEAYSWCLEYPEALVRLYPSCQVSEDRPPRLLFVVERMPDAFHRKIKQLGFPEVDCVEFRHLEFDGVPAVYFESLLRLRRHVAASTTARQPETAAPSTGPSENVIAMAAATRATAVKAPRTTPTTPEASSGPRSQNTPVVSMVTRQAAAPAPKIDRPRAAEPVVLREPEPLVAEPVELEAEPVVASVSEPVVESQPVVVPEPTPEPEPVRLQSAEPIARPTVPDAVPAIAPRHVATATASGPERVSFKNLSTALLGASAEPLATPVIAAPVAAPSPVVTFAAAPVVAPEPLVVEPAAAQVVEASELKVADVPAPAIEVPEPLTLELESTPTTTEPASEESKAAAPPLPQGFEGLKFPNDGVLTRQWMEFLSQMSSSK